MSCLKETWFTGEWTRLTLSRSRSETELALSRMGHILVFLPSLIQFITHEILSYIKLKSIAVFSKWYIKSEHMQYFVTTVAIETSLRNKMKSPKWTMFWKFSPIFKALARNSLHRISIKFCLMNANVLGNEIYQKEKKLAILFAI